MSPATVLLSSPPTSTGQELRLLVTAAGFAVADHRLGSPPAVDFGPVAVAVIDVGESPDVAAAQTRRWRAELGDRFLPVMWVAPPDQVAAGLDAGADVVLSRPVEPTAFAAQLRALARAQSTVGRVAVRAGEARLMGDQLRRALAQLDGEQEMARRVRAALLPRTLPNVGGARFGVCYRPRSRSGSDFHDVRRLDEQRVGFFVGDVVGTGAAGGLLGVFVQQCVAMKEIDAPSYRIASPNEVLTAVNRQLLALGADDLPLVAMCVGVLNCQTGAVSLARGGLPAPVYVPAAGAPTVWPVPGPFLGTADVPYQLLTGTLTPGDRLLIGTDGTRPDGDPAAGPDGLLEAASKHRDASGPGFVDAVARELLQHVRHADDFTLLSVEMAPGAPPPTAPP
ncbi:MAG: SpoIIE family protein phosphatase [Planctomycetes bacterium]|nr:SpoIIE family protein phosphatase [Planctomycetota bacterium]